MTATGSAASGQDRPGRAAAPAPGTAELRACLLAVAVLDDLDLEPDDDGARLLGEHGDGPHVSWADIAAALDGAAADGPDGRRRVAAMFRLRLLLHRALHGDDGPGAARGGPALVPVGWATQDDEHPGAGWAARHVPGEVLDLGAAVTDGRPGSRPTPVGPAVLGAAGADLADRWDDLLDRLDAAAALAAARLLRGDRPALRPAGGLDVLTLLASPVLREALVRHSGGSARVVLPVRSRGWVAAEAPDPAFVRVAHRLGEPGQRGVDRPVLVDAASVRLEPVALPTVPDGDVALPPLEAPRHRVDG